MNSPVLKPCRCVAFRLAIPGVAASSGLRRTGILTTGVRRRTAARAVCDARRREPAAAFLARRVTTRAFFGR